jgi:hypothetical protein
MKKGRQLSSSRMVREIRAEFQSGLVQAIVSAHESHDRFGPAQSPLHLSIRQKRRPLLAGVWKCFEIAGEVSPFKAARSAVNF